MRSFLLRLVIPVALLAAAAGSMPAAATASAPEGRLTEAEYQVLLAAYQRAGALADDADATAAQFDAVCAAFAPRSTQLLAAGYAVCRASARWVAAGLRFAGMDKACPSDKDIACLARELRRLETATRAVAQAARAQKRVVAARGLTGGCARAFNGAAGMPAALDAYANGLRDMRRAFTSDDDAAIERATSRMERAINRLAQLESVDSAALLAGCPRA